MPLLICRCLRLPHTAHLQLPPPRCCSSAAASCTLKSLRQSIVAAPCSSSPLQLHLQLTTAAAAPSALPQLTTTAIPPRCCCHLLQLSFARCCCHHLQPSGAHCCTTCSFLAVDPQPQRHCTTHRCSLFTSNLCGNPLLLLPAAHHRCSSTCSSPRPLLLHLQLTIAAAAPSVLLQLTTAAASSALLQLTTAAAAPSAPICSCHLHAAVHPQLYPPHAASL